MYKIVLLRHGESIWNKKGLFTGWTDVNLTKKGISEANEAGKELSKKGFKFDIAYTSLLIRAQRTLNIVLRELKLSKIPIVIDWRLNERHYGNLQGLNKKAMAEKFGEKQVLIWRRSYSIRPPEIDSNNKYNQKDDPKYREIKVPSAESLKDVVARVIPFWQTEIIPKIKSGQKIIISTSGNDLRAIIKYLDKVPSKEIVNFNVPTGIPLVYELDDKLKPIRHYYLTNKKRLKEAIERVENQGKIKK